MSKIFKTIAKIAPIALPFIAPGIGTAIGGALGATGAGASALGSGLLGAGLGAIGGGGLKGALLGAAGGALSGGLGTSAGAPLSGGLQGPTQGTGILGSLTRSSSPLSSALRTATGSLSGSGSGGSFLSNNAGNLISNAQAYLTQNDMEDKLLKAQGRAAEALSPYSQAGANATNMLSSRLSAGFQPGDLTQDPGYQFRLQEGQRALERSLAAQGMGQSGQAMRAAQEFGQGLADQTYNDAYNRWLQQNSQIGSLSGTGLGAASSQADLAQDRGNIQANAALERSNILSRALSGNRRIIGFDRNGNPIYSE